MREAEAENLIREMITNPPQFKNARDFAEEIVAVMKEKGVEFESD